MVQELCLEVSAEIHFRGLNIRRRLTLSMTVNFDEFYRKLAFRLYMLAV